MGFLHTHGIFNSSSFHKTVFCADAPVYFCDHLYQNIHLSDKHKCPFKHPAGTKTYFGSLSDKKNVSTIPLVGLFFRASTTANCIVPYKQDISLSVSLSP